MASDDDSRGKGPDFAGLIDDDLLQTIDRLSVDATDAPDGATTRPNEAVTVDAEPYEEEATVSLTADEVQAAGARRPTGPAAEPSHLGWSRADVLAKLRKSTTPRPLDSAERPAPSPPKLPVKDASITLDDELSDADATDLFDAAAVQDVAQRHEETSGPRDDSKRVEGERSTAYEEDKTHPVIETGEIEQIARKLAYEADETDLVDAATVLETAERVAAKSDPGGDPQKSAAVHIPGPTGDYGPSDATVPIIYAEEIEHIARQIALETGRNPLGVRETGDRPTSGPVDTDERLNRAIEHLQKRDSRTEKLRALREQQIDHQINWPEVAAEPKSVEAEERPWSAPRSAALTLLGTLTAVAVISIVVLRTWLDALNAASLYIVFWVAPAVMFAIYVHAGHRRRVLLTLAVVLIGAGPITLWALPDVRRHAVGLIAPLVAEQHAVRIFEDRSAEVVLAACGELSSHVDLSDLIGQLGRKSPEFAVRCAKSIPVAADRQRVRNRLSLMWAQDIARAKTCNEATPKIEVYMETRAWDDHQDVRGALLTSLEAQSPDVRNCAIAALATKLEPNPESVLGAPEAKSAFDERLLRTLARHSFTKSDESSRLGLSSDPMQLWTLRFGCSGLLASSINRERVDRMNAIANTVAERESFWVDGPTWEQWCVDFNREPTMAGVREKVEQSLVADAMDVAGGIVTKARNQRERGLLTESIDAGFAVSQSADSRLRDFSSFEGSGDSPAVFDGASPMLETLTASRELGFEFDAIFDGRDSFCQLARMRLLSGRQPPEEAQEAGIANEQPEGGEINNDGFESQEERDAYEARVREECGAELFEELEALEEQADGEGGRARR